jgi:hypothetical protein
MRLLTLVLVLATLLGSSAPALAGDQDFTLVNETGDTIDQVYVSPSDVNDWQEDVLGRQVLSDGEECPISFQRSETAELWDLKVVDADGDSVVWKGLNLLEISQATLRYQKDGTPIAETE